LSEQYKLVELKTEVINGKEIMMSPPAFSNHNHVKANVHHIFKNYLKGNVCIPFGDGEKVVLPSQKKGDYIVPDFFVLCDRSKHKKNGVYGAPDLIAEVLSPGTALYDRGEKKDLYQANNVKEYWIIEPDNKIVEVYILTDGAYKLNMIYRIPADDEPDEEKEKALVTFSVNLFPAMIVNLEDIFEYVNEWVF